MTRATRIYTVATAIVSGASIAFAVNAGVTAEQSAKASAAWKGEAIRWRDAAGTAINHDQAVTRLNGQLVHRYRAVVAKANAPLPVTIAPVAVAVAAAPASIVRAASAPPATATS